MSGEEVGVEMAQEYRFDGEAVCLGVREVLVDVALRVDHDGRPGALVADEIGRMCEAAEIELFEDYASIHPPPRTASPS